MVTWTWDVLRQEGFPGLVRRGLGYAIPRLFGAALVPLARRRLTSLAAQAKGMEDAVSLAFSFSFLGIRITPLQNREEITSFLHMLEEPKPKIVLEIGTAWGGTLFLLTRAVPPGGTVISVDLPEGPYGRGYPRCMVPLYESFGADGQSTFLIRADSHDPATCKAVKAVLQGRQLDLLFLDGDHSYQGVKQDFETYGPMVRNGGIIAVHDILPGPTSLVGEMPRFWMEMRERYNHRELIGSPARTAKGIGVLFV